MHARIQSLEDHMQSLQDQNQYLEYQNQSLENNIDEYQQEVFGLYQENDKLQHEKQGLKAKINDFKADYERKLNASEREKTIDELANEVAHYCDVKQANESRIEELENLLAEKRASLDNMLAGKAVIVRRHKTQPTNSVIVMAICLPVLTNDVDWLLANASWKDRQRMYQDQLENWYYEATEERIEREQDSVLQDEYASDKDKNEEDDLPQVWRQSVCAQETGTKDTHGAFSTH
ncbi:hypothetical protein E8E11_002486 [Didymella keratinophila]|nr:hypothetical protein E8E11_002486 [Didymella keratinophila]